MYAIVKTGGKQYTVRENDVVQIEKLDIPAGEEVVLDNVLFIGDEKGNMIGTPVVEGAKVTGKVVAHGQAKKIIGFTFKPKKNEHGRYGHRQKFTRVLIEKITVKKAKAKKATEEASAE